MPVLADSSVWIDHIRRPDVALSRALSEGLVVVHPFVLGEIALGSIKDRGEAVSALRALPEARVARPGEVLALIERHRLFGTGVGYVDAHLLASALLTPGTTLWTRDRRLRGAAERLRVAEGGD